MHYDQHCDMEHIVKSLQRLLSRLSALLMVPSCLIAIPAPALSLSVPKTMIDNAVNKKFPKEKYSVKLDNPVLRFNKDKQKIALCGTWASQLIQKNGDFCIDFQPRWNKDTGEIEIAKLQLLKLTAGEDKALPSSAAIALNSSLLQLLDGTSVYKMPEVVGKHLESIDIQDSSLRLIF